MEIRDGEEGPKGEHGKDKNYGDWHYLNLLKNLERIPVLQTGVGSNAILYGGCL